MSNQVAIVTDITACLPEECLNQYHISVIPLSVIRGEEIYLDGVDILQSEFYRRLAESKVMPTTSQVTPARHSSFARDLEV
jgi:fatty acid-binding protein DegV